MHCSLQPGMSSASVAHGTRIVPGRDRDGVSSGIYLGSVEDDDPRGVCHPLGIEARVFTATSRRSVARSASPWAEQG